MDDYTFEGCAPSKDEHGYRSVSAVDRVDAAAPSLPGRTGRAAPDGLHQASRARSAGTPPAAGPDALGSGNDGSEPGTFEDRLTELELTILSHPAHDAALAALDECVRRARMRRDSRRLKAKARLLYGANGAGKSTLLEAFFERHPDEPTEDGDIRRVIPVEMPEQTTKRALVAAVLTAMGYKANIHDNANEIIGEIVDKVQRFGVEVILIDEGHHVMTGKSVEAISDFLKSLLNRVKC